MIHLTIDDKPVEVKAGSTVLEAAQAAGIEVPTLCHHPALTPSGACRLCVVEVEGMRGPTTSCTLPASEGMKVHTHTDNLVNIRKFLLSMILSDHPNDCMKCEVDGQCELQRWVYEYQVEWPDHTGKRHDYPVDSDPSPVVCVDMNKCILCGRCVRACQEIQGCFVWNFSQRGFDTHVVAGASQTMKEANCESCGTCVALCPVGALFDKPSVGWGRDAYQKKVRTTCTYCGVGCQFDFNVHSGKITRVTSAADAGVNGLSLCVKGRYGWDFVDRPDRLTTPLIRDEAATDGKWPGFREATWDEALDLVAKKLTGYRDTLSPDSVAYLSSAKCTNEENYLVNKLARAVGKTNNVDHCARLCHASTVAGLATAFGSGAMSNTIQDSTEESQAIFVIGSNTTEQHPVIGTKIRHAVRYRGVPLIVADPRRINLTTLPGALHLRHRPGTDIALVNGIMREILVHGWEDKEFVAERTEGFEEFKETVMKYTLEDTERITGVPAAKIAEAARIMGTHKPGTVFWAMGITQHTTGVLNVMTMANMQMLLGNMGKPGSGVCPLRGQNNVQGACDLGALPNVYPGYQAVSNPDLKAKFEKAWGVEGLSDKPGLTVVEIMNAAHAGQVKAIFILAEDPMTSDPDLNHVREALERVDFLVVEDIFMTETARFADVILPGVSFAEKDGTFTSTERRIQRVRKAVEGPGSARPDWEILCDLMTRMGYPTKFNSPAEIMDELASVTPSYAGVHYDRLDRGEQLHWPVKSDDHPGTPILHVGQFARGKGLFKAIDHIEPKEAPDAEYPFTMTTGRVLYHWHGGEQTRRSKNLMALYPEARVEISPEDAARLKIVEGDKLKVTSRRGNFIAAAQVTERVEPGLIFGTFHFPEGNVNWATGAFLDPTAKIPEYKVSAVKVEKA
ncbi:MAG: formate dehydrogenase subunit alpha [Anaerolineae bacterium]|jgi:formate dehydrogenase alpha subunit|nr:formate dehydrogenase subunit alpha [Anaerolineae bacterium]